MLGVLKLRTPIDDGPDDLLTIYSQGHNQRRTAFCMINVALKTTGGRKIKGNYGFQFKKLVALWDSDWFNVCIDGSCSLS